MLADGNLQLARVATSFNRAVGLDGCVSGGESVAERRPEADLTAMPSYEFRCKDVGMDCGFEVRGASSKEELMEMLAVHARRAHNLTEIPEDVRSKIETAIRKV
jgi:predicted small metal-binding protein